MGLPRHPNSIGHTAALRPSSQCVGMAWETTDVLAADITDVLAADTTDVLPAGTPHFLPAGTPHVSCGRIRKATTHTRIHVSCGREGLEKLQRKSHYYYCCREHVKHLFFTSWLCFEFRGRGCAKMFARLGCAHLLG